MSIFADSALRTPTDLALNLLGPPALHISKTSMQGHRKPRQFFLLAYLAMEGSASKKQISSLFWPNVSSTQAFANLRQMLHRLRADMGETEALLTSTGNMLKLSPGCDIDAHAFLADKDNLDSDQLTELEAQFKLYRGEFLEALTLDGISPNLIRWIEGVRKRCKNKACALATSIANVAARLEHNELALLYANRALLFDPANQEALHTAMLIHSRTGTPMQALALYRDWERSMVNDVAALPAPELYALYQHILHASQERNTAVISHLDNRLISIVALIWPIADVNDEAEIEYIDSLYRHSGKTLIQFGAHVSNIPQGGLLAYFGYPLAQTHSTTTALHAIAALNQELPEALNAKQALHTGMTLCNARLPDINGHLTQIVLQLADIARAGQFALTVDSFKALHSPSWLTSIRITASVNHAAVAQPLHYLLQWRDWNQTSRRQQSASGIPLVGRTAELAHLHRRWQAAQRGQFSMVQISGSAGLGKSHLINTFLDEIGNGWKLQAHCTPYASDTPLHVIMLMFEEASYRPDGESIHRLMQRHVPRPSPSTHGARDGRNANARPVTQEALEMVINGLIAMLMELAAIRPLIMVIEDVHWADPSTQTFLKTLALGMAPMSAALVLMSTRNSKMLCDRTETEILTKIQVKALDAEAGQLLLHRLNPALGEARSAEILTMSGGHPLFLSELALSADDQKLPPAIKELVQIRLDQLGPARKVILLAAVLGASFPRSWLNAVMAAKHLNITLQDSLPCADLLKIEETSRGTRQERLTFSHALLRDAVLCLLSQRQVIELSQLSGTTLTREFPDEFEKIPELAAHWFTDAQEWEEALSWRLKAAILANSYCAHLETRRHIDFGLALIGNLSTQQERARWENNFHNIDNDARDAIAPQTP